MHLPLCIFDLAGRLPPWPSSLACCAFRANLRPAQPGACDGRGGQGHVMLMVNMGGGMESPRTEAGSAGASCFGHAMRGEGGGFESVTQRSLFSSSPLVSNFEDLEPSTPSHTQPLHTHTPTVPQLQPMDILNGGNSARNTYNRPQSARTHSVTDLDETHSMRHTDNTLSTHTKKKRPSTAR